MRLGRQLAALVLLTTLFDGLMLTTHAAQNWGASAGLRLRGADLSFTLQGERAGIVTYDAGAAAPPERVLAAHGANVVRLRVWVNPPDGYSDEASLLALARRAKEAGLQIVVDLHYSDFWADHRSQPVPAAWAGQDLTTLAASVQRYTHRVVAALSAQGTPPAVVQIGNEVTSGLL